MSPWLLPRNLPPNSLYSELSVFGDKNVTENTDYCNLLLALRTWQTYQDITLHKTDFSAGPVLTPFVAEVWQVTVIFSISGAVGSKSGFSKSLIHFGPPFRHIYVETDGPCRDRHQLGPSVDSMEGSCLPLSWVLPFQTLIPFYSAEAQWVIRTFSKKWPDGEPLLANGF